MGVRTEQNILSQSKKAQGETNERLDAILVELKQQTAWLAHIAQVLDRQAAPA